MFGTKKRQRQIIEKLEKIEQQHRSHYHTISAEIACLERDIDDLKQYLADIDLQQMIDNLSLLRENSEFIADVFENAVIEANTDENINGKDVL